VYTEPVSRESGTTTEKAITAGLSEDLMDAWERLRETASEFGEQRIYASHHSIMFSRKVCYFFVRPKKKVLEVWFFLGRKLKAPMIRKTMQTSKLKVAHLVCVSHDEVEPPLTDWLREADTWLQSEDQKVLKEQSFPEPPPRLLQREAARHFLSVASALRGFAQ
jgi:hypothetical protein